MTEKPNQDGFFERCDEIRKIANSFRDPLLVHHYDADGLSSGAIVLGAFRNQNRCIRHECIKKLDDLAIERYIKEKEIIFTDLGSGNKRVNELKDVVVIDHHQIAGNEKPQANPITFGISGDYELSASGAAYCVFREHADLAIVGATGDMQMPFTGLNKYIVEQGVKLGEIKVENDLRFYGRYSRPLVQFLAYSDSPHLPGISYREDKAAEFLEEMEIPLERDGKRLVYSDLDESEKRRLVSGITNLLVNKGVKYEIMGENYIFPKRPKNETYEASDFSTLLNACGRHEKSELGLKVCLGDENAYDEARMLLFLHRKMIREGIAFGEKSAYDIGAFYLLDARGIIEEGVVGIVIGMMVRPNWEKPILGLAEGENNTIKISGRTPKHLVSKGLNLGELMRNATNEIGNGAVGGGHKVAAGASIPKDKINEFLIAFKSNMQNLSAQ